MSSVKVQYKIILDKDGKKICKYREAGSIADAWNLAERLEKGYKPVYVWRNRKRISKMHKRGKIKDRG